MFKVKSHTGKHARLQILFDYIFTVFTITLERLYVLISNLCLCWRTDKYENAVFINLLKTAAVAKYWIVTFVTSLDQIFPFRARSKYKQMLFFPHVYIPVLSWHLTFTRLWYKNNQIRLFSDPRFRKKLILYQDAMN